MQLRLKIEGGGSKEWKVEEKKYARTFLILRGELSINFSIKNFYDIPSFFIILVYNGGQYIKK